MSNEKLSDNERLKGESERLRGTITDDLASGRLLQVLPDWQLPSGGIYAVFPPARFRPAKVRALVDCLLEQGGA